jgi:iron(III) transport system permease protein
VLGVVCLSLLFGVPTAWLVAMCEVPGRRALQWALMLPMAMPSYIVAYVYTDLLDYSGPLQAGLRALFGWQGPADYWFPAIRSLGGAAWVLALVLFPYVYLLARTSWRLN